MFQIAEFAKIFIALVLIMDPFTSLPVFIALTRKMNGKQRLGAATTAALVAGAALVAFVLAGQLVLGITIGDFRVASGVLLFLLAVQYALGIDFGEKNRKDLNLAVVIIAVPLITGPGAMTTAIIFASESGVPVVVAAIVAASAVCFGVLGLSGAISRLLGMRGIEIVSRITGVLWAALGVSFIRAGLGY
ncbi:MarC family protein [Candidatus Parvarchaeota archaeon]|nr:MarC family protein [Candidatus Parvarchaeota archaeon]